MPSFGSGAEPSRAQHRRGHWAPGPSAAPKSEAERGVSIERLLHCAEAAGSGEDESPDGGSPAVEDEESEEQRAVKARIADLERAEARIAENDSVLGSRLTARQRGSLSRIRRELKEQRATLARLQTTRSPQGSTAEENARKWKESVSDKLNTDILPMLPELFAENAKKVYRQ